ncbi:MAG: gliding motility-associated C-terminal domain-containing protein, partial [Saprospiraceae bacterium]
NGIITLNVTNGKPPVQFDWGNGFIPANVMGGFAAGSYTVHAMDAVLCEGTFDINVTDNPPLQLSVDTLDISCFGANNGMAKANPVGGVSNFTYQWSDGQTVQKATDLGPGEYAVTVYDGNECSITGSVYITEPADVGLDLLGVVDLLCNGVSAGEIDVTGTGGKGNYQYSVDGVNFVAASPLTGLAAGDYWVIVKDAAGCVDSVMASIQQPPPVTVTASPTDTTVELGFPIDFTTFTTPFGRPVIFEWTPTTGLSDPTSPNPTIQGVQNQLYIVKVTDEDGCMASDTVRILVEKERPIYVPNVFAPDKPYPNDHFTLFGGPAAEVIDLLRVYDRWGGLVFETRNIELNDPNLGWNGTYKGDKVQGVFTFYASVRFIDEASVEYKGSVTVVR